jgi:hypothetical protein
MSHVKNFKDWQRLFEEAQQTDQQSKDWEWNNSKKWAIQNGYYDTRTLDYDRYGNDIYEWNYSNIKKASSAFHIAKLLFHSYATAMLSGNDTEAVAEAAFEALVKNPGWYSSVKAELSKLIESGKKLAWTFRTPSNTPSDPYSFCKFFMSTSTKYQGNSPSIDESYKKIQYTKK